MQIPRILSQMSFTPIWEWSKANRVKVTLVAAGAILLIAGILQEVRLRKNPTAKQMLYGGVKFGTVVLPLAYTATFPIVTCCYCLMKGMRSTSGREKEDDNAIDLMYDTYLKSIVKVWSIWFKVIGYPSTQIGQTATQFPIS